MTRLRAAVDALPSGPTRDRFGALLAAHRHAPETTAQHTDDVRPMNGGPRTVRIPAVAAAYEPAPPVGHHRRRWRRS